MLTHRISKGEHAQVPWSSNQDRKQKEISADSSALANNYHDRQEWMRVRQTVRCFGIGRSSLYKLLSNGVVKSVSIKQRGALRGIRLINADSVRSYLDNLA